MSCAAAKPILNFTIHNSQFSIRVSASRPLLPPRPRFARVVATVGLGDDDLAVRAGALEDFEEARELVHDLFKGLGSRGRGAEAFAVRAVNLAASLRFLE